MARLIDKIGRFVTIPNTFVNSKPSHSAMHLFVVLRMYADNDTGVAFPSIETLSRVAGMKRNTVTKAVKELIAGGWLARVKRYGKSNVYAIQFPTSSIPLGTVSSIPMGTTTSTERDTVSRPSELDPVELDGSAPRPTAVPESAPSLSAIPDDLRAQKAPPRRKPDYFGWQVVKSYLDATGRKWIAKADADFLNENVSDALKFAGVAAEWIARGYNPTNFAGLVDVYHNGWRPTPTARKAEQAGDKFEAALELIRGRSEVTL